MIGTKIRQLGKPGRVFSILFDYDYASPNLVPLPRQIESSFPNVHRGGSANSWVPHRQRKNWRINRGIGLASWDESTLLYNYALNQRGHKVLEIGCWVGWTSVIFLMAGDKLTVIDPVFIDHPAGKECRDSIAMAGFEGQPILIGGYSPEPIDAMAEAGERFSFFFIDGNHEGDAPLKDAKACSRAAADDCVMIFHDAIQPNILEALEWLKSEGWNCGIHYTSNFLGVATRGSASPLKHVPDPAIDWDRQIKLTCPHLLEFPRF